MKYCDSNFNELKELSRVSQVASYYFLFSYRGRVQGERRVKNKKNRKLPGTPGTPGSDEDIKTGLMDLSNSNLYMPVECFVG